MDRYIDEKRAAEIAVCQGHHVPTLGEKGVECAKCGKELFDYQDTTPEAAAAYAEARRIIEAGFKRDRLRSLTAEEMRNRSIEIIDQAEATLIEIADRTRINAMNIPDVLQLLIGLRSQIRRIE
jgi:hypothetical protein